VISCRLDKPWDIRFPPVSVQQSTIYNLLGSITEYNDIYRAAGGVHGCAL
jgi:FdhD protein